MDTLECSRIADELYLKLRQVRYNADLHKMYKNIERMVEDISKAEVVCRQRKNYSAMEKHVEQFKEAVDRLEKLILIALLME